MSDLKVSLENIIPLTYARDHFSTIVNEVQRDKLYILTKGGKPAVAIIDVRYLEQITGGVIKKTNIQAEIAKNPEQVGIPRMIDHSTNPTPNSAGSVTNNNFSFRPSIPPNRRPGGSPFQKPFTSPPQSVTPPPKPPIAPTTATPTPPPAAKPAPPPFTPPTPSNIPPKPPVTPPPTPMPPPPAPTPTPTPPPPQPVKPIEPPKPNPTPPPKPLAPVPPPKKEPDFKSNSDYFTRNPFQKESQQEKPEATKPAPATGQLIMPGSDNTPKTPPPPPPAKIETNGANKIEVEFRADEDETEAAGTSAQTSDNSQNKSTDSRMDPDDKAPAAQYNGGEDEPVEMEIG